MINFLNKICPELLKVMALNTCKGLTDCIIYGSDYKKIKTKLFNSNITFFEYPFMNAFGAKLSQKQIMAFAKVTCVTYITKQTRVFAQVNVAKQIMEIENFYNHNIHGANVTIAVIDTGVYPHIDFTIPQNRIVKFVDLVNNKTIPYDDNGHGTFVASVLCGNGLVSGYKYSGVAPKSRLIMIKALEENGEAGAYKILQAMQWVYDNKTKYNIRVVCMSFGSNPLDKHDPLVMGAESLWNSGIVIVAAAGNSGPSAQTIKLPGASNKIITVGGINDNRTEEQVNFSKFEIANFSSRGPAGNFYKPDVVAPAVNINGASASPNNFYTQMSGTSVATPLVAGACALIISRYPNITPDQLKVRLLNNCKKLVFNRNVEGFGLVNFSKFFIN